MLEEPFLHSPKAPSAVARLARTRLPLAAAFLSGVALTAATFSLVPRHVPDATADALAAVHSSGLAPTTTLWEPAPEPIDEGKVGHETPYKFAVKSVTPVSLQLYRGTCWIFAAIAVLEASYRRQGVARGWLAPTQYLKLSEQAFGVAVLDLCRKVNSSCGYLVGNEIWTGAQLKPLDTQGGESYLLYYLLELRRTGALPVSVCPYTPKPGNDHKCHGLEVAREQNPLRFEVAHMYTGYERQAAKMALLRGRNLALSTSLLRVKYMLPCTQSAVAALGCDPKETSKCLPCPDIRAYAGVECCVEAPRDGSAMDGDFFTLATPTFPDSYIEGGHAMTLVGFNDMYRTRRGFTGGFILKNSWWDGLPPSAEWKQARGSHSIAYYMQVISAEEEAFVCPNSHNPERWYSCDSLSNCHAAETRVKANRNSQPLHLECIDRSPYLSGLCTKGERYFLTSIQPYGGGSGLSVACFLHDGNNTSGEGVSEGHVVNARIDDTSGTADDAKRRPSPPRVCTPPVPLDDVALVWSPIEAEVRPNNPDVCGFYFFPYEIIDDINARDQNFQVNDMDVVWHPEAYAANAKTFPELDYTLIEQDTLTQFEIRSSGPLPYKSDLPSFGEVDDGIGDGH